MTARLLPPNASTLELILDEIEGERLDAIETPLRDLWSVRDCPERLLPYLASAFGVEQWADDWPISVRRARVASAMAIHRHKGTVAAVKAVISAYGGKFTLSEWFQTEPIGDPFTFALAMAGGGQESAPTAAFLEALVADITRAKPARAHFTVSLSSQFQAALTIVARARPTSYRRLSFVQA